MRTKSRHSNLEPTKVIINEILALRPSPEGSRPAGTALRILQTVESLICERGFEQFSMRAVASTVGISLASLQYHFATKADLLKGFFDFQTDAYQDAIVEQLAQLSGDPRLALTSVARILVEDSLDEGTDTLYRQLWAMACHDTDAARWLDDQTRLYLQLFEALIRHRHPNLTSRQIKQRSTAIVALVEGLSIASGRIRTKAQKGELINAMTASIEAIAAH